MLHKMLRLGARGIFVAAAFLAVTTAARAVTLDKDGTIKLGVRTYVNARVGTQHTKNGVMLAPGVSASGTFPYSDAGHLRQNRAFLEAELNHDLKSLVQRDVGPLTLLNNLPFKFKELSYHLTFRAEADGIYDWGPAEYRTAREWKQVAEHTLVLGAPVWPVQQAEVPVGQARSRLRRLGTHRERLFQAYGDFSVGNLFTRIGRQILAWGETDGFRLLDNINPLDGSFGGFLIALDERRVPLDMVRMQYYLGDLGPLSEMFVEGYGSWDNDVGFSPGTPAGSPWALPSLGNASNSSKTLIDKPARTFQNMRGGGRFVFNAFDATFSLVHYHTFEDIPTLKVIANPVPGQFANGRPLYGPLNFYTSGPGQGYGVVVHQEAPKVQITGATTTFAVPDFYSIVRGEIAYFKDEAAFTQCQLDPFCFMPINRLGSSSVDPKAPNTGGRRTRDSWAMVLGLDKNHWIRLLNPNQTFFISTQVFFKQILTSAHQEVLPPSKNYTQPRPPSELPAILRGQRVDPQFVTQPKNQLLQTFFIGTSYRSGTINPGFTLFYDWGGAILYQPSLSYNRDPFRVIVDYSLIDAHTYKGGSGISLLKDRDNVQFRVEYVL